MAKNKLKIICSDIRLSCIDLAFKTNSSHIGSSLSIVDILVILYFKIMKIDPKNSLNENRDRFILSKGHACLAMYCILQKKGFFDKNELYTFGRNGTKLMSHVSSEVSGVEFSTGSLGHGLPFAVGKALYAKNNNKKWKVYVLLSDGELNEGSNWEAIQFASHHKLSNLTIMIDSNKEQSLGATKTILDLGNLKGKFETFNLNVIEIDGHNLKEIEKSLLKNSPNRANLIIFNTTKGKGVSFMENKTLWHYKSPNSEDLANAIKELKVS